MKSGTPFGRHTRFCWQQWGERKEGKEKGGKKGGEKKVRIRGGMLGLNIGCRTSPLTVTHGLSGYRLMFDWGGEEGGEKGGGEKGKKKKGGRGEGAPEKDRN